MKKNQKGFTIIELIVVIAIIAILAAIVMVNVTKYIQSARDTAIFADLNTLLIAHAAYAAQLDPATSSFCFTDDSNKVGYALTRSNPGFYYSCYDENGNGRVNDSGVPGVESDPSGGESSCTDGKWLAFIQSLTDSNIIYCIDSTGHTTLDPQGPASDGGCYCE